MKIPAEELAVLIRVIQEGAVLDPHAVLKVVIAFFIEHGLTTAEILNQLIQLGYFWC